MPNNEGLERYATSLEREALDALTRFGGDFKGAAEFLDLKVRAVYGRLQRLRARAARRGWSPDHDMIKETPEGFHVKGTSTLYDADGTQKLQWVKTCKDQEDRVETMRIALEELTASARGSAKPVRAPRKFVDEDLMATYLLGDHHLGMYAWAEETGQDYDCDIASDILLRAFQRVGAAAPKSRHGLIISVGDFFHADNVQARTPTTGNALDVDSRHALVTRTGIRLLKLVINFALKRHETVEFIAVAGNHDPESSMWLAYCLEAVFSSEPRVTVRTSPRAHQYVTWGDCLIGTTHGDKGKPTALMEIMAADAREDWGRAKWCHWYTGHIHHKTVMELRGGMVESLSVLAPGDAWHIASGYRSRRGMKVAVWHKTQGCVMEVNGTVEMINAK